MQTTDLQVLRFITDTLAAGDDIALATVVRTWGSSPRPAGALLAIRADGAMVGSVSGGCVDADIRARYLAAPAREALPVLWRYGVSHDERHRFQLPCSGVLEVLFEPRPTLAPLTALRETLESGAGALRRVDLRSGAIDILPRAGVGARCDGRYLYCTHGPARRLLLIGAGQTSHYLARFAQALDYEVTVCDPREEYTATWNVAGDVAGACLVAGMPDDVVRTHADARTAVVALTHDPKLDDLALLEALVSPAFYVGALGSRANNVKRRARLQLMGLDDAAIARLHGPVGLRIGSRTPAEIAIAILAELTATIHGVDIRRDNASTDVAATATSPTHACA